MKIKENRAICLICGELITSPSVHFSRTCSCGNLTVDGGTHYLKRTYKHKTKWKEFSIYEKEA